jgi:hypothetical protein
MLLRKPIGSKLFGVRLSLLDDMFSPLKLRPEGIFGRPSNLARLTLF